MVDCWAEQKTELADCLLPQQLWAVSQGWNGPKEQVQLPRGEVQSLNQAADAALVQVPVEVQRLAGRLVLPCAERAHDPSACRGHASYH